MDYPISPDATKLLSMSPFRLLINGEWVEAHLNQTFTTINPSDGTPLAQLAQADAADVDRAVTAAREALAGPWGTLPHGERSAMLRKLGDLVTAHAGELAELESLDNGKPIWHTKAIDAKVAARQAYEAAGWPSRIAGYTPPVSIPNHFVYTRREPIGVVGIIIPWNYPLIHTLQKVGPALACGNTVILKPAEQASLVSLRLGGLMQEAGFPPGVINILTGDGATGAAMVSHPGIDKIQFTGSVAVGKQVVQASAGNLKRISLELGNKAANIIFDDVDLETAIAGAFKAAFGNTGQSCVAGARLYVQKEVYEQVVERLVELSQSARIGQAMDPATKLGPIIDQHQLDSILTYIKSGLSEGAMLMCGGMPLSTGQYVRGFYLTPTIFTNVRDDMTIAREEIFGPVLCIFQFETEAEVIARANNTPYGLAAGVWTKDVARAQRVAAALKTGTVWINTYDMFDPTVPFGGRKQSGYGRDNGREVIESNTDVKSVWIATT
jgi:acyl-CoA reductase-like NAD-dependent aldehyde dehydrogenase